jgi:hypothetical protein
VAVATFRIENPNCTSRGYANEAEFTVAAHRDFVRTYTLHDFVVREGSSALQRENEVSHSPQRSMRPGHKSQSEADWAYARRALARGDDPQEIIRRIADYRADEKHDPMYYARLTVVKAQLSLFGSAERSP